MTYAHYAIGLLITLAPLQAIAADEMDELKQAIAGLNDQLLELDQAIAKLYGNNKAIADNTTPQQIKAEALAVTIQQPQKAQVVRRAQGGCLSYSAKRLEQRAAPYADAISTYAKLYGIEENLIKSVIAIESCYQVKAASHKGAQGLMQLIPATAERFGVTDVYDSSQNIRGGARYLSWLLKRFNGDMRKTLAGYNAGEGAVDKYNGIPPYQETQHYVRNVLAVYERLNGKLMPRSPQSLPTVLVQKNTNVGHSFGEAKVAPNGEFFKSQLPVVGGANALAILSPSTMAMFKDELLATNTPATSRSQPAPVQLASLTATANHAPVKARSQAAAPRPSAEQLRAQQEQQLAERRETLRRVALQRMTPEARKQYLERQRAQVRANQGGNHAVVITSNASSLSQRAAAQVARIQPQVGARVSHSYKPPVSKPGRAGWQANRALAPYLYKQ